MLLGSLFLGSYVWIANRILDPNNHESRYFLEVLIWWNPNTKVCAEKLTQKLVEAEWDQRSDKINYSLCVLRVTPPKMRYRHIALLRRVGIEVSAKSLDPILFVKFMLEYPTLAPYE